MNVGHHLRNTGGGRVNISPDSHECSSSPQAYRKGGAYTELFIHMHGYNVEALPLAMMICFTPERYLPTPGQRGLAVLG